MSTATGNVVIAIKAVDEASGVLGQLSSALTGALSQLGPVGQQLSGVISGFATAGPMGAAVAGIGSLVVGLKSCVEGAIQAEDVWNRLKVTVEKSGESWAKVGTGVQTFAESMSNLSRFTDEEVAAALKTMMDYGMDLDTAMKNMAATMDLAAAKQVSLETSATAVGKAFSGQEGILNRMGVVISDTVPKAEKFSAAMGAISEKFGGAAQADVETFAGKWTHLTNKLSELGEKIGTYLIPGLTSFAEALIVVIDKIVWFVEQVTYAYNAVTKLWEGMTKGANDALTSISNALFGTGNDVKDTFEDLKKDVVSESIWPDMWAEMIDQTDEALAEIGARVEIATEAIADLLERLRGGEAVDLSDMLDPLKTAQVTLEQMDDCFGDLVDSSGSLGEALDKLQAGLDSGRISMEEMKRGFIELSTKIVPLEITGGASPSAARTINVTVYSSVGSLAVGNRSELDDYLKQVYRTVVDAVRSS